ncbi:MAG: hypothetical protein LQ343_002683 [Gyalolechia ehrenbergii]|nr:MAG: hypothetical protein LQ343_002683 [Gyalolechia ehrenbergii]
MIQGTNREKSGGSPASTGHKRSISGTLLSKLSFSSPTQDEERNGSSHLSASSAQSSPRSPRASGGAMAAAMKQSKTRKRKGSLRKTALLGTGRLRTEQAVKSEAKQEQSNCTDSGSSSEPQSPEDIPTPTPLPKVQPPVPWVSHPVHGILHKALIEHTPAGKVQKSPTLSSTTDEDDLIKPNASPTTNILPIPSKPPFSSSSSTSDSYFPPQPGVIPRRTRHSPKSPLSTVAAEAFPSPEVWDYTETRWWGWVVLAVTWIVFVVGMGSCLGVWSWAWDVGETPSAPPELEDDPTLPIVGYYPALIILTGIMAWVWVTVAWVGMKYFKHAKMGGDDEG